MPQEKPEGNKKIWDYQTAFWTSIVLIFFLLIANLILFDYLNFIQGNNSYLLKYFIKPLSKV